MFDRIAGRYDLLNRVLSLGLDRGWRRRLVAAAAPAPDAPPRLLDVATGTADVALALARSYPQASITGLDPSEGMLEVGRRKVDEARLGDRIELVMGDARALPLPDAHFASATVAFGIRNVPDRGLGLAEMARVVAPGGVVAILELAEPRHPVARFHVHRVVPAIGGWLSGADAYRYLKQSIAAFPPPERFMGTMEGAGLTDVRLQAMLLGVAHLYTGRA